MAVGASKEELRYHKSITLQLWLFAYEIPGERLPPKMGATGCSLALWQLTARAVFGWTQPASCWT